MIKRVELKISGNVQGVFFRHTAKKAAELWGITGWTKNEHDGTVTIVAEGEEDQLKKLIEWARKGPEPAEISKVEEFWGDATGEFKEFSVRY